MGFTPLAGVTMGTRSGNLDPALIPYIMEKTVNSRVVNVLNKKSGMLGLTGYSSDLRDIIAKEEGDHRAKVALDVFVSRIHIHRFLHCSYERCRRNHLHSWCR